MTGRTHAAAAIVFTTIITHKYNSEIILGAFIGGLLPDIDTPKSMVSDLIPGIDNVWSLIRSFFSSLKVRSQKATSSLKNGFFKNILKFITNLFAFMHDLFKHRGILTHSAITILIILLIKHYNNNLFMYALLIGVISHHLMDLLTDQGLNYLYPLINKKLGIKLVSTGSVFESGLYYLIIIFGVSYYLKTINFDIIEFFKH